MGTIIQMKRKEPTWWFQIENEWFIHKYFGAYIKG